MNKYETVFIMSSKITQKERNAVINKITKSISDNGKVNQIENRGLKKLAYEIRENKEGYYYIIQFESDPNYISELERLYRITDEIIKFIIIRDDD